MTEKKESKFIDTHVHGFPDRLFDTIWNYFEKNYWHINERMYTPQIIPYLQNYGAIYCTLLNYAHKPGISHDLNSWTYAMSTKFKTVLALGTIHPDDPNLTTELDRILSPNQMNFYGIKLQLMVTDFDPDYSPLNILYEKMLEYRKILVLHVGTGPIPAQLLNKQLTVSSHLGVAKLRPILERYPKLKLQIPHLGCMECNSFFDLALDYPNVMFDTSMTLEFVVGNTISEFPLEFHLDRFIELQDRIMFGSDFPNIPYNYSKAIDTIHNLPFKDELKRKLLFRNAERFYDIEQ